METKRWENAGDFCLGCGRSGDCLKYDENAGDLPLLRETWHLHPLGSFYFLPSHHDFFETQKFPRVLEYNLFQSSIPPHKHM